MREHFMIITDRRFFSIKIRCQKMIFNNIVLVLIFSHISQPNVIKILLIKKEHFFKYIDKYLKKLKVNKSKLINQEKIFKNK